MEYTNSGVTMKKKLTISNFDAFVRCRSIFGEYLSICNKFNYTFRVGTTILFGDIDDYPWAISYILSNFKNNCDDFILNGEEKILYLGNHLTLSELTKHTCYLDREFNNKRDFTVREYIEEGCLIKNSTHSIEEIKELFSLTDDRMLKKIDQVGNEFVRSLAAIGYVDGKDIFCFPWLSAKKYKYYQYSIDHICRVLTGLGKIVIVPTNNVENIDSSYHICNIT